MKQQNMILSFIPWIVFSSSAGFSDFLSSAFIALVLNIIFARNMLLKGFILELGGVVFFSAMVIMGLFLHHGNTFTQHPNLWSNVAMMAIMLGSVLINKPFAGQYTDKGSHLLHVHLSTIWGLLILVATLISIAHVKFGLSDTASTLGTIAVIFLGVKANQVYPKFFYNRTLLFLFDR